MPGNTFGKLFRITTFGESHGKALGVVIDGCPAGLELDLEALQLELARRKPGQNRLVSPRKEDDAVELLSGVFEGKTTGTPLMLMIVNQDAKSKDYSAIKDLFRPGHADFTYHAKYGIRDYRGGGRASARETASRVIGGAVCKQLLASIGVKVVGGVTQIGSVKAKKFVWESVEDNEVRSVDPDAAAAMVSEIETARKERDSVGGRVRVLAEGVPPGWGEPVFEKLDAAIAGAMMSIPAVKAVEIGAGAACAAMRGTQMNDLMYPEGYGSNNHGGVLGGILDCRDAHADAALGIGRVPIARPYTAPVAPDTRFVRIVTSPRGTVQEWLSAGDFRGLNPVCPAPGAVDAPFPCDICCYSASDVEPAPPSRMSLRFVCSCPSTN